MNKWNELNDATRRELTIKRRNAHALAAKMRRAGAHSGPKRPVKDDTEEQLEEFEDEQQEEE